MSTLHLANAGSSFAAGPGLPPYSDRRAGRSLRNAASLAASELGAHLYDVSVGGATAENLVSKEQRVRGRLYPPQLSALMEQSQGALDLVTVTVGGNDVGYIGHAILASLAYRNRRNPVLSTLTRRARPSTEPVSGEQRDRLTIGLIDIIEGIRVAAPSARILLVGYLTLVPPGAEDGVGFHPEDAHWLRRTGDLLDDSFARAAAATGAEFVDMGERSAEHGAGSPRPWIRDAPHGLRLRDVGAAFHPNEEGTRAIADAVIDQWHQAP